jgi:integrase
MSEMSLNQANQVKTDWQSTNTQNLIRYRPSGTYFARFKIGRKPFRKSLKTKSLTTARLRLNDMLRDHRAKFEAGSALQAGKMTFAQAMGIYLEGVESDVSLKPASKHYRQLLSKFIVKTWPELKHMDVRKINERDCQRWLHQFQRTYAPSVVNNSIGTLRAIFNIAVNAGARFENPTGNLKRVKVRQKHLQLPTREQFEQFVKTIETAGAPQSADCAALVKFLAYSGLRISESWFVTWRDVDFKRKQLFVRGSPQTATKNDELRVIPLIPQLDEMLTSEREKRSDEPVTATVMRVRECQKSMDRAAKLVGMHRITHHDLRHLFATVCIESGVDIPTISRWLGHKDGGALCMKTYGHLRTEHGQAQAMRVVF